MNQLDSPLTRRQVIAGGTALAGATLTVGLSACSGGKDATVRPDGVPVGPFEYRKFKHPEFLSVQPETPPATLLGHTNPGHGLGAPPLLRFYIRGNPHVSKP